MKKQVFRLTEKTGHIKVHLKHTEALTQMHAMVQPQALESERERQELVGQLWGPGEGAKLTSTMLAASR